MFKRFNKAAERAREASDAKEEEIARLNRNIPSSGIGELVVFDPRDPIVWMNSHNVDLSPTALDVCWAAYRAAGDGILLESEMKFRDRINPPELIRNFIDKMLTDEDKRAVSSYQEHLGMLAAAESEATARVTAVPMLGAEAIHSMQREPRHLAPRLPARHRLDD